MEITLIEVTWNVKEHAVDFTIPAMYDHVTKEHKQEVIEKLEFLAKALKEGTYPYGNL